MISSSSHLHLSSQSISVRSVRFIASVIFWSALQSQTGTDLKPQVDQYRGQFLNATCPPIVLSFFLQASQIIRVESGLNPATRLEGVCVNDRRAVETLDKLDRRLR